MAALSVGGDMLIFIPQTWATWMNARLRRRVAISWELWVAAVFLSSVLPQEWVMRAAVAMGVACPCVWAAMEVSEMMDDLKKAQMEKEKAKGKGKTTTDEA